MSNLLLDNGTIYTMDPKCPRANAVAIVNGRVAAFDNDARALRNSKTQVIDLRGRTVIPGLVDAHIHFTGYAMSRSRVQLEGARSLEEAVARVAARVKSAKSGDWIFGRGWNQLDWKNPQFPNKKPLDAVAPANPVALTRKDGHSMWLNSAALSAANITRETTDPSGGLIERDAHGEPTGLLREKAMALVSGNPILSLSEVAGNIGIDIGKVSDDELLTAIRIAHKAGLTGVHNIEGTTSLRAFQSLRAKGKLTMRVKHMIPAENLEHAIELGLQEGFGDDYLHIGGVKIFADGALGSQTAWMLEPFEGHPENCGLPVTPPNEIERLAHAAAKAGLDVVTHAIGDRANREVLNVYEKLRREKNSTTLRIEHVQHLHPADLPRFRALNVIASMQPIHATSDYQMADVLIGKRARYSYAWQSLLNAGATLLFGSDCPVEILDPLAGIHAAATRERANGEPLGGWYPEERVSVDEAVRAYTIPLHEGSLADCVVLSQNIFPIPAREILSTRVEQTIVGGEVVYAA